MSQREEWESELVEYQVDECTHCTDQVFVDSEVDNIDDLPRGINIVIGGGEHISVKASPNPSLPYRVPKVVAKWFTDDQDKSNIETQYLCPACANSLYGYDQ